MMKSLSTTAMVVLASAATAIGLNSCATMMSGCEGNCNCGTTGVCVCAQKLHANVPGTTTASEQLSTSDKAKLDSLINKDYSIVHYEIATKKRERMVWKDDTIKESAGQLTPMLLTSNGRIIPKNVAFANNRNDVFFYFNKDGDKVGPLRLCVQYYADDPLKYNELVFTIDGFDYSFKPSNIKRGKGSGIMIWENSDDALTAADRDLVYALAHSEYYVQLKLCGAGGMNHVKRLTDEQKQAFYNVLQLYRLQGGKF